MAGATFEEIVLIAMGSIVLGFSLGLLILMAWEKYHDKNR